MTWGTGRRNLKPDKALRGFTLIELLITLTIMTALAGLSFPKLNERAKQWRVETSSRELQIFMNFLQERAVVERNIFYLEIGPDGHEYWGAPNPFKMRRLTHGIRLQSEVKQVAFFPDGSMDPVTIQIVGDGEKIVTLTTRGSFGSVKIK